MDTIQRFDGATELRYALDVMEEYSHLGLDDEFAGKLREILVKRIEEAEAELSVKPVHSAVFATPVEIQD